MFEATESEHLMFSKENNDVSRVFLAYLAFLGNTKKVAIALDMQPEEVEVLAAKEDWKHKLKIYLSLHHEGDLSNADRAIRRAIWRIHARHLSDLIGGVLVHLRGLAEANKLIYHLSARDPPFNRPKFSARVLLDLANALRVVAKILDRLDGQKSAHDPEESPEQERLILCEATSRAMRAMDCLPGVDSVGLAKESLAKWDKD